MPLKAVLIDMDDTLLRLDTQAFTRRYLEPLSQFIIERTGISPDQYRAAFSESIRAVNAGRDPLTFNSTTMNDPLRTGLQISAERYATLLDEFFAGPYAGLREGSSPAAGAGQLVNFLKARGLRVVVATNPLFNTVATHERLRWASIDPASVDFITTADNMHFVKPSPHYYLEILGRIGVNAEDALMIGDDLSNDITPAVHIGLSTFHVRWNTPASTPRYQMDALAQTGALSDVEQLISEGWPPPRLPGSAVLSPEVLSAALLADVAALHGIASEMTDQAWNSPLITDRRSPSTIVDYLITRERTFERPNLERIIHEDNPFIQPTSEIPVSAASKEATQIEKVRIFADERGKTIAFVNNLSADQWRRTAQHAVFGPTGLTEMVGFLVQHDRRYLGRMSPIATLPLV